VVESDLTSVLFVVQMSTLVCVGIEDVCCRHLSKKVDTDQGSTLITSTVWPVICALVDLLEASAVDHQ
jgi:hypothetical protein